jgi:dihydroorotase/N-acyl-D-amino-acid deacylase
MSAAEIHTLIRGGRVVDGTGNPWQYADVALCGDRVAGVLPWGCVDATNVREVVDASGMVICPGFIDIQSHSIIPLMTDARCLSKIAQGVTTEIMGEAWTPAPFGGKIKQPLPPDFFGNRAPEWNERARGWTRFRHWLEAMAERGVSPNIGSFLGAGTLREYVKGMEMGVASPEELSALRRVTEEAMADGAFGVSYALIYPPDAYANTDEIVEVCKVVARHHGVYITHLRSEGAAFIEAVEEAFEIGRRAGVPVEIYHLKASGRSNWDKIPRVIEMIDRARADGLDVTADMYPYVASGTGLSAVLPPWASAGGKLYENVCDPQMRLRLRAELEHPSGDWEAMASGADPSEIMPVGFQKPEHQAYVGKRLSEIAEQRGQDWIEAVLDLLGAEEQRISTIYFKMSDENLRLQLQQPWIKISTDAGGLDPVWAAPTGPTHPRAYGTYPRVLGHYVRDEGVLGLEDAVRKMSSSVADRLGLRDRGLLRAGHFADVVVFDPATIADRATFAEPHELAVGVRDVWVNGVRVYQDATHTGATPGSVVAGPGV